VLRGCLSFPSHAALDEGERVVEFDKRYNGVWPPEKYVPETIGWRKLMKKRFAQVAEIDDIGEKYEAYLQTVSQALTVPNFTEYGSGLVRARLLQLGAPAKPPLFLDHLKYHHGEP
jgi:hypothetical protein